MNHLFTCDDCHENVSITIYDDDDIIPSEYESLCTQVEMICETCDSLIRFHFYPHEFDAFLYTLHEYQNKYSNLIITYESLQLQTFYASSSCFIL